MMTLFQYRLLCEKDQVDLLYKEGTYIGKRSKPPFSAILFQLGSFYVEIYYRKYRSCITEIKCFTSTTLLDPYLEQINVDDLVRADE
jgi:hypothetical protein